MAPLADLNKVRDASTVKPVDMEACMSEGDRAGVRSTPKSRGPIADTILLRPSENDVEKQRQLYDVFGQPKCVQYTFYSNEQGARRFRRPGGKEVESAYNPVCWTVRPGFDEESAHDGIRSRRPVTVRQSEGGRPAASKLAEITGFSETSVAQNCGPAMASKRGGNAPVACLSGSAVKVAYDGLPALPRPATRGAAWSQDTKLVIDPANSTRQDGGCWLTSRPMSRAARLHYEGNNVGSLMS